MKFNERIESDSEAILSLNHCSLLVDAVCDGYVCINAVHNEKVDLLVRLKIYGKIYSFVGKYRSIGIDARFPVYVCVSREIRDRVVYAGRTTRVLCILGETNLRLRNHERFLACCTSHRIFSKIYST